MSVVVLQLNNVQHISAFTWKNAHFIILFEMFICMKCFFRAEGHIATTTFLMKMTDVAPSVTKTATFFSSTLALNLLENVQIDRCSNEIWFSLASKIHGVGKHLRWLTSKYEHFAWKLMHNFHYHLKHLGNTQVGKMLKQLSCSVFEQFFLMDCIMTKFGEN